MENETTEFRFNGRKPASFQLEKGGDVFMIGSEVGHYLNLQKGALYKRFPSLWRRIPTLEERRTLLSLDNSYNSLSNSNIMLVKALEVEEILQGAGTKYRDRLPDTPIPAAKSVCWTRRPSLAGRFQISQMLAFTRENLDSSVQHLNAVTLSTNPGQMSGKRVNSTKRTQLRRKIISPSYDDHDMEAIHKAGTIPEVLVPIRLDIDIEGQKLRDTFTWNKNETLITPETFAEVLCDDLDLSATSFVSAIAQAIGQQSKQFDVEPEIVLNVQKDQRIIIKLNIHVGNISLVDQFEWDISDPLNNPEQFALGLCSDLGLGGEFVTAVAYSIRGQLSWHQKTYAFSEAPLPKVENPVRSGTDVDNWGPYLETLTDAEMEKKLRDQDRNTRYVLTFLEISS
ncbi:hypothetical protein QZH41_010565 [Actinostola sp. cb2023]|nr:hypothetical protein QZH41_010565 [Actinostola sp. cb2023]